VFADAVTWAARYASGGRRQAGGGRRDASEAIPLRAAYAGLHIAAAGTRLVLRATDGDAAARAEVDAGVAGEGEVVLPAKLLADVATKLPKEIVILEVEGAGATLTCGGLALQLQSTNPADFPSASELPPTLGAVRAGDLREAVKRVVPGIGDEDQYPQWRSFGILAGPALRIVATDRARLPAADTPWQPTLDHQENVAFLAPRSLADIAATCPPTAR